MFKGVFLTSNILNQLQQWYSESPAASGIVTFIIITIFLFALIFSIIDD